MIRTCGAFGPPDSVTAPMPDEVVLVVDGEGHRLASGDAAAFDSDVAHSCRNGSGSRPARFRLAVHELGDSTEVRR